MDAQSKQKKLEAFITKNIAWILLVLAIILGGVWGEIRNNTTSDIYEKKLDSINKRKIAVEDSLTRVITDEKKFINDILNQKEKTYYDDFIKERKRRINAEKNLENIRYRIYDKRFLDSLARFVEYR